MPVRVAECKPSGLLKPIVYIDLVGKDENETRDALLEGVKQRRAKPSSKPNFPGKKSMPMAPPFPGSRGGFVARETVTNRYMPKLRSAPSDLEKRRFIKGAFEAIRQGFDSRLHELEAANLGLETDLTLVDATAFTAEIFINGPSRAQCRIWQGTTYDNESICYVEGSAMRSMTPTMRGLALRMATNLR